MSPHPSPLRRPSATVRSSRPRQRGTATAELATLMPFALVLVLLLAWTVSLGLTQVSLVDAAREGARSVARGATPDEAAALARRMAPDGSTVDVLQDGDGTVRVEVAARSRAPLFFAEHVGTRRMSATAVAVLEEP